MPLTLFNTLSRKKEVFEPLEPKKVKMYVCGPTVYNFIHVGNARPAIFFDVVKKFLKKSGYEVTAVVNYTDVDDKIIQKARELNVPVEQVTEKFIKEYATDMKMLSITLADKQPKVTDHIPQIISLIEKLIQEGVAYAVSDGEVFYSVRKFNGYGKLSGKILDELVAGARVNPRELKQDPLDFSLWKPQKSADEPSWDSPWGKGRPGWHIECSAMAIEYLGESFDLHGGGMDLMHPHHENEIAQAEGATHKPFVKYWMHNNMLTVDSEKMSKSIGNIFLTRAFVEKYGAETLKFLILWGHYRSTIDFSDKHILETQSALHRIYTCLNKAQAFKKLPLEEDKNEITEAKKIQDYAKTFPSEWFKAMEEDFNTPKALALVFDYVRLVNTLVDKRGVKAGLFNKKVVDLFLKQFEELSEVFNLFKEVPSDFLNALRQQFLKERNLEVSYIEQKIKERDEAKFSKNYTIADEIRKELISKGIELRDTPTRETEWDILFQSN